MISFNIAIKIVDDISKHSVAADHWQPIMREDFADGAGKADSDLTIGEFLAGLSKAVDSSGWGLWLDVREANEITDRALGIIETRVGIPEDPDWAPYEYDGDSIEEGLAGFDRWLLDNYLRNRDLPQLRLVEVATGSDFYLSILHPEDQVDELIKELAHIGVTARRQTTAQAPVLPLLKFDDFDDSADFAMHYLQVRFGYTKAANSDRFRLWVDEQHAVITDLVASPTTDWGSEAANADDFVAPPALEVCLLRRDIADLQARLEGYRIRHDYMYSATIRELSSSPFLGRPVDLPSSENEIVTYLETWIPQLNTIANLEFIGQHLETKTAMTSAHRAELNRALNGQTTAEDRATLAAVYPEHENWDFNNSNDTRRPLS